LLSHVPFFDHELSISSAGYMCDYARYIHSRVVEERLDSFDN
jgi:hypothetical protein